MKNDKQRLFEVMGRLDKTFKPKLNEGFEEIEATNDVEIPVDAGEEVPVEEKSVEEKYEELKAKVEELYGMVHGEEAEEEIPAEEVPAEEIPAEEPVAIENLEEWNFDKKKGEKKDDEKKEDKEETEVEVKVEVDEAKEKIPVASVAKVGK